MYHLNPRCTGKALAGLPRGQRQLVLGHVRDGLPLRATKGELASFEQALEAMAGILTHV